MTILGGSLTLSFAPFNYWFIVFISLPCAFIILTSIKDKIFTSAWFFGLGYFSVGLSWVHVSIADFGGVPLIGSIGLMFLLCGYLALYPALLFYLLNRFFNVLLWPLAIAFIWLVMEWLRARMFTGFPWLSIGYSQTSSPLATYYPLIGEIGLSALIVLACMSLAVGIKLKKRMLAATPIIVMFVCAFSLSGFEWTKPNGVTKTTALVQGNIPQSLRWDPEQDEITKEKYIALTEPFWNHDIIVWPEAAVPSLEVMTLEYIKALDEKATETNTGIITGVVNYNARTEIIYNSLLALGIDEQKNSFPYHLNHEKRFSKHHLLPIGEFVPFENLLRPLAPIFDLPMSSFSRGDYIQPNLLVKDTALVPAICFEIAFPKQISANIYSHSDAIVTVSNDAWFGNSHGPHQHLQIAQVRASEFGLPVIRATNNGVTALIDHKGNIQAQAPQFVETVLSSEMKLVTGMTPYYRFGDAPIYVFAFTLFVSALLLRRKNNLI